MRRASRASHTDRPRDRGYPSRNSSAHGRVLFGHASRHRTNVRVSVCVVLRGLGSIPNPTHPPSREAAVAATDDSKALAVFVPVLLNATEPISTGPEAPTDLQDITLTDGEASEKLWRSTNGPSIQQHGSVRSEQCLREDNWPDHRSLLLISHCGVDINPVSWRDHTAL